MLLRTGDSTSSDPVVTTALAGAVEGQQVSRLLTERAFDQFDPSGPIPFHVEKMWQSSTSHSSAYPEASMSETVQFQP